ncbi:MAG: Cna B-type domain-containing protein [Ruminococcaceae bacterium]|nr:Cna B-type domain-containing protein [Oscillospiraceae bacterium]
MTVVLYTMHADKKSINNLCQIQFVQKRRVTMNRTFKNLLSLVLALTMLIGVAAPAVFADDNTGIIVGVNESDLKCDKTTEKLGNNKFQVSVKVPGGDDIKIHDEVIVMVDGSYSVDEEWAAMRDAIIEVGNAFLDGTGNTQLTLMAFGMSPTVVEGHVKSVEELTEILSQYQGNLLYGRSATNCAGGFDGITNYIKAHDDTLGDSFVIYVTDGGVNVNNKSVVWFDYVNNLSASYAATAAEIELSNIVDGVNASDSFKKLFGDDLEDLKALYTKYVDSIVLNDKGKVQSYDKEAYNAVKAYFNAKSENGKTQAQLWAIDVFESVFEFAGLDKKDSHTIYTVEKAFVDYRLANNTRCDDAFYYTASTCSPVMGSKPINKQCAIDAAKITAEYAKEMFLVQYANDTRADWMKNVGEDNVHHVPAGDISNLSQSIQTSLKELVITPYNDVVVVDYMSKWVILDPETVKVVDVFGNVVAEFDPDNSPKDADGNYSSYVYKWVGEALCAEKAPVIVDLVSESEYEAGGPEVVGNTDGPIHRIIWNIKDGPLMRNDVYKLQYEVFVNTEEPGFVYDKDLPSNGNTTAKYEDNDGGDHEVVIIVPNVIADEAPITVSGEKTWIDANDKDGIRPESITIKLYADSTEIDSIEVTEADGWRYSFENLPKYAYGKEIVYSVSEEAVEGYTTVYDGYNVINTHVAGTEVTLSGIKYLDGDEAEGFEFILADENGKVLETVKSGADGRFGFAAIAYSAEGVYKYSVKEVAGSDELIDYDESEYTVTVTITKAGESLEAAVEISKDQEVHEGEIEFYNETLVEIPDELPPLGDAPESSPETGDNTNAAVIAIVCTLIVFSITLTVKRSKND